MQLDRPAASRWRQKCLHRRAQNFSVLKGSTCQLANPPSPEGKWQPTYSHACVSSRLCWPADGEVVTPENNSMSDSESPWGFQVQPASVGAG